MMQTADYDDDESRAVMACAVLENLSGMDTNNGTRAEDFTMYIRLTIKSACIV